MPVVTSDAPRLARPAAGRPAGRARGTGAAADAFPGLLAAALPSPTTANALGGAGGGAGAAPAPHQSLANQLFSLAGQESAVPAGQAPAPASATEQPADPTVATDSSAAAAPPAVAPAPDTAGYAAAIASSGPAGGAGDAGPPIAPTGEAAAVPAVAESPVATPTDPALQFEVALAAALSAVNGAVTAGGDPLAETVGAPGTAAPTGGTASTPEAIRRQVATQLLREQGPIPGEGRVTLRLDPPHLGRVDVKIERAGDVLTVTFTAQTPEVERALRGGSGDLQRAIAASGGRWSDVRIKVDDSTDRGGADRDDPGEGHDEPSRRRDQRRDG